MMESTAPEPPMPAARLLFGNTVTYLYPGQTLRVGRAAENDLVIDDPKVSRGHAQLEWTGAGFSLRDLGSVNGTFVNGERLGGSARPLRDGDTLAIHTHPMQYWIERVEAVALPQELGRIDEGQPGLDGPRLLVTCGPDSGQVFPLWGEQITLGRGTQALRGMQVRLSPQANLTAFAPRSASGEFAAWEIRLNDPSISRPHARLERRGGCYYLLDLASANGTQVNGQPVDEPVRLSDGDLIDVGATQLRFIEPANDP